MFNEQEVKRFLQDDVISIDMAQKLLNIYVCDGDWVPHLTRLRDMMRKRHGDEEGADLTRKTIAYTILLPHHDWSINKKIDYENPGNNLFTWKTFHQFNDKDWLAELKDVVKKDVMYTKFRRQLVNLGVIAPIEYHPFSRQALKWLYEHAEKNDTHLTHDQKSRFKSLVMAYGGAVVSNIFEKHESKIKQVTNWRTPYFFEHIIFDIYSFERVAKIKMMELEKANSELVKKPLSATAANKN